MPSAGKTSSTASSLIFLVFLLAGAFNLATGNKAPPVELMLTGIGSCRRSQPG
jgi:hypothetical protein